MRALSRKKQIELLTEIKSRLGKNKDNFLCNLYWRVTKCPFEIREDIFETKVPLFNFENAQKFGAELNSNGNGGWWPYNEVENRGKYIDWMIEELQKKK
jgi:hypothetical protein